ncbi:MAG: PhzF family phenazine biosynthesis protein [Pirellulales bacterium]
MSTLEPLPLYLVDAFAERPFSGNPAAVCLVDAWPDDAWLQSVAAELKHSETAFVRPGPKSFDLRWFTPALEVDLCGHATLASACVLWHTGRAAVDEPIRFSTRSGILTAREQGGKIGLDFPLDPQTETRAPPGLLEALGVEAKYVGQGRFDFLVELASEAELRRMAPDFVRLAAVDCRGVIVTARSSGAPFDFVSRFFAPASGVDEDPVTGSAHCTLAHFWQKRLGRDRFQAYQASRRGGVVGVSIDGDRVLLTGRAVLVFEGRLRAGASP